MNKTSIIAAFTACFTFLAAPAFCQAVNPIIAASQTKMKSIERTDAVIEKTVFDFIYKDNGSKFDYNYKFYASHIYTLAIVGDESRGMTEIINVFKIVNGEWKLIRLYKTGTMNSSVQFTPDVTGIYDIQIVCTLKNNNDRTCVGLIIDREN